MKKDKVKYLEARGGRKTAVARVRLIDVGPGIVINGRKYTDYFAAPKHRAAVDAPLSVIGGLSALGRAGVSVHVRGGGLAGQAEAIRHGLARVLTLRNAEWRKALKRAGFLRRDPRVVERKKYGLKKARRAPQWSKR